MEQRLIISDVSSDTEIQMSKTHQVKALKPVRQVISANDFSQVLLCARGTHRTRSLDRRQLNFDAELRRTVISLVRSHDWDRYDRYEMTMVRK